MARREIDKENIRKLQRTGAGGASYMVTLPKRIIDDLDWRKGEKVVVERDGDRIVIENWGD